MQKIFKKDIIKSLLNLIFPNICIHCEDKTGISHFLCDRCISELTLLKDIDNFLIAAFENIGPLPSMVRYIRRKNRAVLDMAAAFMVYRYLKLEIDLPSIIIPIDRKDHLLAEAVSKIMKRRVSFKRDHAKEKILFVTDFLSEHIFCGEGNYLLVFSRGF